ncbi:uncharacterized protein [Eucyclogobius newberryi]|uniref:uncharacterized protein n=1 Tax=Eucyclogobius newberryi TaxID=166745 RepID=UPI003B5C503C
MSDGVHNLKVMLHERLAAMAREVSELFDGMIALHEREMRVLKQRNMRQQHILDSMLKPRVVLHRTDIQILSHLQEEIDSLMDLGRTTEPPHIKEEQEELSIKLEQGELQEFTYTSLTVKCEDEENKPPASHLRAPEEQNVAGNDCLRSDPQPHRHSDTVNVEKDMKTDKDDLMVSSPSLDRNSGHFQSDNGAQTQKSSDTDDSHEWSPEPQSGGHESHGRNNESVNEEVIFECPRCLKTFLRKGQTPANHSKRKDLTCKSCSVSKRQRKSHRKVHTGKSFTCEVCEKGFTREDNLNTHMLIHKGERPHPCTVCNKSFKEAGHLKAHVRIHTGEKPFSCSVCKKCFTHRATRNRHERNHSGERPYSCSECRAEFKQRAHYHSHLRVHSRERPYNCPVCNKTYSRNSHVTSHMKVHDGK